MSAIAQTKPDYTYWQSALAGKFLPVHDGDPQLGFYRKRTKKAGPFVPVAIWDEGGKVVALVDCQQADPAEIWTYVCQHPITEEQYRERVATGKWHDEDEAVTSSLAHDTSNAADPVEAMADQIDAALAGADEYKEITTDEAAAKAQSLRSRLLELSGEADKTREAEKKPHLEAGRAVDAKWQPLVKKAKEAADRIRAALGAHETRKAREEEDRRIKAEPERVKAAAEAALKGGAITDKAPEPAPAPVAVPEQSIAIRGAYGRAAAVKVVKVAKVVDQDAAYGFLKSHKELIDLIGKLSQRAVDAGYAVPGVSVTDERRVS